MCPRAFRARCLLLCSVLVTGLSLLSVRLIQIQSWDGKKYAERARAAYDRSEVLPGLRGKIVDRHEEILAKSIGLSTVMIDAMLLSDPVVAVKALARHQAANSQEWELLSVEDKSRLVRSWRHTILEEQSSEVIVEQHLAAAVRLLARPLGLRREELRQRIEEPISKGRRYFAVAKDLPEDLAENLRSLIDGHALQGFRFENSIKRWYCSPDLATHVIGYTGEQVMVGPNGKNSFVQVGKFGIEKAMEDYLRGKDGIWKHSNMPVSRADESMVPPVHGLNVRLTIDLGLQSIVAEELDLALGESKSKRGCAVLLNPTTGELLAMASRPHFNLNLKEGLDEGAMNYALQGIYEPGSTYKIVAVAGCLNEKVVSKNTSIFCHNGLYTEGKLRIPDHHPYGMLTVEGVLQKSSNIGAFKLARQLGTKRFFDYSNRFGFGQETGILLSGESSGIVKNTGNLIDFSRASYGYALNVTPLQVAAAYGAIANGGELICPSVVHSIIARDGTILERFEPNVVNRAIDEDIAKTMRAALVKVVEKGGTATLAAVPGFKVAGKTGTARRVVDGRYQEGHYTVSFVGMMPADDPAFVCLVVIDDPLTTLVPRYGGTIAAPAFAKIASRVATHMNLSPTEIIEGTDQDSLVEVQTP